MYAELTSALAGLKTISDLASLALRLKVDTAVTQKAIESQAAIIDLQSAIFGVQTQNQELLEENKRLKQELIDVASWESEAQKYMLAKVGGMGAVAYVLKPEHREGAPDYWLCPNCYNERRQAILQRTGEAKGGRYVRVCSRCPTRIAE